MSTFASILIISVAIYHLSTDDFLTASQQHLKHFVINREVPVAP